jgi:hypothetical protein
LEGILGSVFSIGEAIARLMAMVLAVIVDGHCVVLYWQDGGGGIVD